MEGVVKSPALWSKWGMEVVGELHATWPCCWYVRIGETAVWVGVVGGRDS